MPISDALRVPRSQSPAPDLSGLADRWQLGLYYFLPLLLALLLLPVLDFFLQAQEQPPIENPPQNVAIPLANPSFEQPDDGVPVGWTPVHGRGFTWDDTNPHTGRFSARMSQTIYRRFHLESEPILLNPQNEYTWLTLSGWIKTERSRGEVYLALAWYDASGNPLGIAQSDRLHVPPADWVEISFSDLPPDAATHFTVWCASDYNPGTVWFDDLHLTATVLPRRNASAFGDLEEGLWINDLLVPLPSAGVHQRFLADYPDHPLAAESTYCIERQKFEAALALSRQKKVSAAMAVLNEVSVQVPDQNFLAVALGGNPAAVDRHLQRYEQFVDEVLYQIGAHATLIADYPQARQFYEAIVERQQTPMFVQNAQINLDLLTGLGY